MKSPFVFFLLVLIVCAWCPWYDSATAQKLIAQKAKEQQAYNKYCKLTPKPETIHKILFGYGEDVLYDCMIIEGQGSITTGKNIVVATFINVVVNMPQPAIVQ